MTTPGKTTTASPPDVLDVARLRADFPALAQCVHGRSLVYLDNAATTQKPRSVIDALVRFYEEYCSNVHRGIHSLSQRATDSYEAARTTVRHFLNAADDREIVFVRGATEAINLVADVYGRTHLGAGDEILISEMEHHSNIVPWQILTERTGARLRVVPIDDSGELIFDEFERLLGPRTRLVSIAHVSNALGTVNPVARIIEAAHAEGVPVLVDGAQSAPHLPIDVQALDCDFYTFSGHKIYGPTGIGVLYGKAELMEALPPYQSGGEMIRSVTFKRTTYAPLPARFEAGTPNIAGAIGLGEAIGYLTAIGLDAVGRHEQDLLEYGTRLLEEIDGVRLIGTAPKKAGVLSFTIEGVHPHDAGTILDHEGIAVRTGHHCAQPVMDRFGVPATTRASLGVYNTREELDALVAGIGKVIEVFARHG